MRPGALLLLLPLLATSAAAQTACEAPTSARDLADASAAFYAGWDQMDAEATHVALGEAEHALRCIDEPLTAPDAVGYFQIVGLGAFLDDDTSKARDAFRAAQGILPNYALPSTIAQPGDDWYEMYEALRSIPDDGRMPLTAPEHGWATVDGARASEHPSARPWLLQQFDTTGAVVQTAVVWTREKPPGWVEVEPGATPQPAPAPVLERHPSRGLLAGGIAATAVGLGGLAGAGALRIQHNNPDTPDDVALTLVGTNRLLGGLGYAGVATGAGLVTGALVVGRW